MKKENNIRSSGGKRKSRKKSSDERISRGRVEKGSDRGFVVKLW